MKTALIFLFALIVLISCEPEIEIASSEIPQSVLTEFNTRYASATNVEWGAEKDGDHFYFEARFKINGIKKEAHFTSDGTFMEEEK